MEEVFIIYLKNKKYLKITYLDLHDYIQKKGVLSE